MGIEFVFQDDLQRVHDEAAYYCLAEYAPSMLIVVSALIGIGETPQDIENNMRGWGSIDEDVIILVSGAANHIYNRRTK